MKRYTTMLSALALSASMILSSCSSETKQDHYDEEQASLIAAENKSTEQSTRCFDHSFNCKEADLPEGIDYVESFTSINNDTEIMIIGSSYGYGSEKNPHIYLTDRTLTDFRSVVLEESEDITRHSDRYTNYFPQPDGSICAYTHTEEHEGMKIPDTEEEAMNFDWDSYYAADCVREDFISCYDKTGKLTSTAKINYAEDHESDEVQSISGDSSFIVIAYRNGSIIKAAADGSTTELRPAEADFNESESFNVYTSREIAKMKNGKWVYMEKKEECIDGKWGCSVSASFIDINNGKLDEPFYKNEDIIIDGSLYIGFEYPIMEDDWQSLFCIDENGQKTELINWTNSDLSSMAVTSIGQNEYIGFQDNGESGRMLILTPKDSSEFANVTTLTISQLYDSDIINKFNRSQDKYRIVQVNTNEEIPSFDSEDEYTKYYNEKENQFALDVISGNAPDILIDLQYSTFMNLSKKGALADLYEFMDKDEDVPRKAIMPNLLKALESPDGKLFMLCEQFGIETIITKSSICDKENWTVDDMISLYDNAPASAKHLYDGNSKEEIFRIMFSMMDGLVDYNTASCSFDSPETVKLLEFCNRFVDKVPTPDKGTDGWEANQAYYSDRAYWWGREETLLEFLSLDNVLYYSDNKYYFSDGSDVTFVGYPSANGQGGRIIPRDMIAINNTCADKQGAWEFIKFYITNTSDYSDETILHAIEKRTDEALYKAMSEEHTANGRPMPNIKDSDREMISEYIRSCSSVGAYLDDNVYRICTEEAERYFKGEISAQEAASLMQNRASIAVSEKY